MRAGGSRRRSRSLTRGSRSEEFLAYQNAATLLTIDANGLQITLDPENGALGLGFEAVE